MVNVIKAIFYVGPLLFGLGFLTPLTAQIIQATAWTPPFGMSPLIVGVIVGGTYGLIAQVRGRWI